MHHHTPRITRRFKARYQYFAIITALGVGTWRDYRALEHLQRVRRRTLTDRRERKRWEAQSCEVERLLEKFEALGLMG